VLDNFKLFFIMLRNRKSILLLYMKHSQYFSLFLHIKLYLSKIP